MKDRDNFTFLTSAPVHHVILVMAVPTIISMLVTSIYNIVTTFYVGRISTQATAAVGIAFSVMAIIQAIGFTFGQGSGNYISRELGAQRHDNAYRMASTGFFLAVGTGLLLAVIGLIFFVRSLCCSAQRQQSCPMPKPICRLCSWLRPLCAVPCALTTRCAFRATRLILCSAYLQERASTSCWLLFSYSCSTWA